MDNHTIKFETRSLNSQFDDIAYQMENYYGIFYAMVNMGRPVFTDSIETACVKFNEMGENIEFCFNPKFWEEIDDYTKMFVICHECLHVILSHGIRTTDCKNRMLANAALDVVVNHMLVNKFGFEREKLTIGKELCWIDTVFRDPTIVLRNQSFEYYYDLLLKDVNNLMKEFESLDLHETLKSFDKDIERKIADKIASRISDAEIEEFVDKIKDPENTDVLPSGQKGRPGEPLIPGSLRHYCKRPRIFKKKWESVIYRWAKRATEDADEEQWLRKARRYATLPETLMMPTMYEIEGKSNKKLDVMFFLDSSGSCWHLKDRFFAAAISLNPNRFNVRLFSRSTHVKETSIKTGQIDGGGSDDFRCIEKHIQKELAEKKITKYPDAVFHITDGYDCSGVKVKPEKPENWYTFLTDDGTEIWLPEKSHVFKLSDFE